MVMYKNILTIGSVICRSGEGISRDIRSITETGNRARPVIVGINPSPVEDTNRDLELIDPKVIERQIEQSFDSWDIGAVKIGFLGASDQIKMVTKTLLRMREKKSFQIILDPTVVNHDGKHNYAPQDLNILKHTLMINCDLLAPSLEEARILSGLPIETIDEMAKAAETLITFGSKAVLIRGGLFGDNEAVDILATLDSQIHFKQPALMQNNVSGAKGYGGVVACVIASALAEGLAYKEAIDKALAHVQSVFLSNL